MNDNDDADNLPVVRKPVPKFWFEDGNVVLSANVAKNEPAVALFRVHKSQLSRHSPVFDDMFGLGGLEKSSDVYEGAPLVHLEDDLAHYVSDMCNAIYNPLEIISLYHFGSDTFEMATPLFIMFKKYDMVALKEFFLPHIRADWPKSLSAWDMREDQIDKICDDMLEEDLEYMGDPESFTQTTVTWTPEPVSAILFAEEFDFKDVYPLALYDLSRLDMKNLYNKPHCTGRPARWKALSGLDYRVLLLGREKLLSNSEDLAEARSQTVPINVSTCKPGCVKWYKEAFAEAKQLPKGDFDILRHFRGSISRFAAALQKPPEGGPCQSCCKDIERGLLKLRDGIWNDIPTVFAAVSLTKKIFPVIAMV